MTRHYGGHEVGLWYIQESTEGQTPNTPSMLHLAHKATCNYTSQGVPNAVEKSGDRDFTDFKKGVETYVINLTFKPSTASGNDFIKNFIDTNNSFTLLAMIDEASNIVFGRFLGCKIKRISPTVQLYPNAGALEVNCEIWAMDLVHTEPAGASYESAPNSFVNWSDCSVQKDAVPVTNWWDFGFSVDYDLFRVPNDQAQVTGITRGRRRVEGNLTTPSNATVGIGQTEFDEQKDATAINFALIIDGDTYNFTSSAVTEAEVNLPLTDLVGIKSNFQGARFSVA